MHRTGDEGQRTTETATAPTSGDGGKRSRVEAAYPTLARKLAGTDAPSIDDAATAAVEHKGGGGAVDGAVAARVGAHLGADFSGVRVHTDPLAQEASAAIGARAFAHGHDVFLGAGESGSDLGLMAHELTHVAQQGAAGRLATQRKIEVGDAGTPAEHEADAVSAAVTGGAPPAHLLVDDGPPTSGQMLKSAFIAQLREAVTAAADEELGPLYSAIGCPYIDQYFGRYHDRPAADGEALLRRFAPGVRGARSAAEMIPIVTARVREGVRTWRDTGQAPPDLPAAEPAAGAAAAAASGAAALRAPDGRETLASLEADLGAGQALDGGTASRMGAALGVDLGAVRVHVGPAAASKAAAVDALAFAAGPNIVMAAGAPTAGTPEGDALLAHELAHAAQQADAAQDPVARRSPLGHEDGAAETQADQAAAGAVAALHAPGGATAARTSWLRSGLQLQRCPSSSSTPTGPIQLSALPATITAPVQVIAPFGTFTVVPDSTTGALGNNQMRVREIRALETAWTRISAGNGIITNGSTTDVAAWRAHVQRAMSDSPTLRQLITDIGNDPDASHAITANVGRSQAGVIIDSFGTNDVDLDDIELFPVAPSALHPNEMTLGEQIVHILAERRAARTSANPNDFNTHHATATASHNQYRAERGQAAEVSATGAPTGSGGVRATITYTDGTQQTFDVDGAGTISNIVKP